MEKGLMLAEMIIITVGLVSTGAMIAVQLIRDTRDKRVEWPDRG